MKDGNKARSALTGMYAAADLLELVSGYLDNASMDVMDIHDEKLGYSFMGSLTVKVQVIDDLRKNLLAIVRDVEVDQGLRPTGGAS